MDDDHTLAILEKDVDDGIFVTLRAIADYHEERGKHGDKGMAAGYRWLADHKREPKWRNMGALGAVGYAWCCNMLRRNPDDRDDPEDLPLVMRDHNWTKCWDLKMPAYRWAARKVGAWLRRQQEV